MGRERIVSLQILRFVAAMMVVVGHASLALPEHARLTGAYGVGAAGVDVFFVLSGFVIALTGPLAEPRPSGALFFWRRWRRVAPFYFLMSLPTIIGAWRVGALSGDRLAATFLFWPAGARTVLPYLEPGWSLCFEMAFYTAVSFVLTGGRVARNLAIVATCLCGLIALRAIFGGDVLTFLANPIDLEFAAGIALAALWTRGIRPPVWLGLGLLAAGLGGLATASVLGLGRFGDEWTILAGRDEWTRLALFGLPAATTVYGALTCERLCRGRVATMLAIGGDASYAIYLTHLVSRNAVGATLSA